MRRSGVQATDSLVRPSLPRASAHGGRYDSTAGPRDKRAHVDRTRLQLNGVDSSCTRSARNSKVVNAIAGLAGDGQMEVAVGSDLCCLADLD